MIQLQPEYAGQVLFGRAKSSPTPASILGALYHSHFYATDSGISTAAGKVTSVPNRGLDGAPAVQNTLAVKPDLNATAFNGGPGIVFDGSNDELHVTFTTPIPSSSRPYAWVVMRQVGAQGYFFAVVDTIPLTANWFSTRFDTSPPQYIQCDRHISDGVDGFTAVVSNLNPTLVQIGLTVGGVNALVVNGSAASPNRGGTAGAAMTAMQLGMISAGVQPASVVIAEVILAGDMPSAPQIAAVNTYLRATARNNGLGYAI